MGSSSDVEIVTKAAEGRGQRTRKPARPRASVPSPIAKKTTARASKGKGKATAVKEDSPTPAPAPAPIAEDTDSDLEMLPSPRRPGPSKPKPQAQPAAVAASPAKTTTVLEIPSSSTAAIFSSDPPAPSLNAQLPRSASTSAAIARPQPSSSSKTITKPDPPEAPSAPSSSRPGFNKSSSAPTVNKRVPAPKKKLPAGGHSSDDVDDFFAKAKPAANAQAKRVPGRRPGSSGAVPSSAPRVRKMVASDPEASESSSSSSSASTHSDSDSGTRDPSLVAAVKHSKLPDWTRNLERGTLGQSGSAVRAAKGKGNRKKRRMDVDSEDERAEEEEKELEQELADEDTDDSFASVDRKRKGKGKEEEEPERERTRSLTPPELVEARKIRDIVAETRAKTTSPIRARAAGFLLSDSHSSDDDLDTLDPEMLRIRNQRPSAAQRRSAVPPTSDDDLEIMGAEPLVRVAAAVAAPMVEGVEEDEQTEMRVSMTMDPERPASEAARRAFERSIPVQMGMKQSFSYLYETIGEMKDIDNPLDSLVFTHRRNRLYPFGTPTSLKIPASVGADIKCYTMEIWEKVEKARREGRELAPAGSGSGSQGVSQEAAPAAAAAAAEETEPQEEEEESTTQLFRLTIRGSATQSIALAVKPSILLSSLLGRYCKKFEIPQERQKRMWLEFDGEKLDGRKRLEEYEGEIEDEETMDVGEARG